MQDWVNNVAGALLIQGHFDGTSPFSPLSFLNASFVKYFRHCQSFISLAFLCGGHSVSKDGWTLSYDSEPHGIASAAISCMLIRHVGFHTSLSWVGPEFSGDVQTFRELCRGNPGWYSHLLSD